MTRRALFRSTRSIVIVSAALCSLVIWLGAMGGAAAQAPLPGPDFTLSHQNRQVRLSWQAGTADQLVLWRSTDATGFIQTPLAASATSTTDTIPPTASFACYRLFRTRGSSSSYVPGLCVAPARAGFGPAQVQISVQASGILITWSAVPQATDYDFLPFGYMGPVLTTRGATTWLDLDRGAIACYIVFARRTSEFLGWTDVVCADTRPA